MFSFDSVVRYSELSEKERLSLTGLVNYFQDCSTFQSEALHVGVDDLVNAGFGWVLSYWQIVIKERPMLGDRIQTGTWAYDMDNFFGYRNFVMKNEAGEMIAAANSIWVFLDIKTGHPTKIGEQYGSAYEIEPKYDNMEYEPRKIKVLKDMEAREPFLVKRSNIDTNHHVNNGQYIMMAQDYLPEDFEVKQIRAEYKTSAVYGD